MRVLPEPLRHAPPGRNVRVVPTSGVRGEHVNPADSRNADLNPAPYVQPVQPKHALRLEARLALAIHQTEVRVIPPGDEPTDLRELVRADQSFVERRIEGDDDVLAAQAGEGLGQGLDDADDSAGTIDPRVCGAMRDDCAWLAQARGVARNPHVRPMIVDAPDPPEPQRRDATDLTADGDGLEQLRCGARQGVPALARPDPKARVP